MRQFDYIPDMMSMALRDASTLRIKGRVVQVVGTIIKAVVPKVKVGEVCLLRNPEDGFEMDAEVVGFQKDAALLTPLGDMVGISGSTEVIPTGRTHMVPVGFGLLGRVLDGLGRPMDLDACGPLKADKFYPVMADAPDPKRGFGLEDLVPTGPSSHRIQRQDVVTSDLPEHGAYYTDPVEVPALSYVTIPASVQPTGSGWSRDHAWRWVRSAECRACPIRSWCRGNCHLSQTHELDCRLSREKHRVFAWLDQHALPSTWRKSSRSRSDLNHF